jgi:hypothetical protein
MTERLKVAVLKTAVRATVPRVRIPLSPPVNNDESLYVLFFLLNSASKSQLFSIQYTFVRRGTQVAEGDGLLNR